jgi:hypothetical protein
MIALPEPRQPSLRPRISEPSSTGGLVVVPHYENSAPAIIHEAQTHIGFFDVSAEIRNHIYSYLVERAIPPIHRLLEWEYWSPSFPFQLTCRQAYREVSTLQPLRNFYFLWDCYSVSPPAPDNVKHLTTCVTYEQLKEDRRYNTFPPLFRSMHLETLILILCEHGKTPQVEVSFEQVQDCIWIIRGMCATLKRVDIVRCPYGAHGWQRRSDPDWVERPVDYQLDQVNRQFWGGKHIYHTCRSHGSTPQPLVDIRVFVDWNLFMKMWPDTA